MLRMITILIAVIGFNSFAHADIWVGNDINVCNYSSIQDALDEAEKGLENNIRIANDVLDATYFENLNLDTAGLIPGLTITAGYDQCQGIISAFPTIIDGSNTAPVLNLTGGAAFKYVTLNNLVLKNGYYDVVKEKSGGLNVIGGDINVFLNNVSINDNTGILGGGLYAEGPDVTVILKGSNIFNNTARNGGGLACDSASVQLRTLSALSYNTATSGLTGEGNGGGANLSSDCYLTVQSGSDSVSGIQGIVGNQASNHGGGIYLATSSSMNVSIRNGIQPVIKNNIADSNNNGVGNGGGIYATGATTSVDFRHGSLSNNEAVNGGGAVANDLADVRLFQNSSDCYKDQPCTVVSGNKAGKNTNSSNNGTGGAFYASNQGTLLVIRSAIKNNVADTGLVATTNSGGVISISASFITNNGDDNDSDFNNNYLLVAVDDDSQIILINDTVAGNVISDSSDHVALIAFGARMNSNYSIIQDDSANILETFEDTGQATSVNMDCNVLHEIQTINGINFSFDNIESTAVDFVDPGNSDYHIQPTSVAVDFCDDSSAWNYDVDGDLWGFDDLDAVDVNGVYDAGADETYTSDVIFKNGFN